MSHAAPGRTQQLLDASLRQVRLTPRTIICNTTSSTITTTPNSDSEEDLATLMVNSSLNGGAGCKGKGYEVNLVREKRKALALYLKCKHLPSQVITCPGEKVTFIYARSNFEF
jgi:hypothetical protein